MSVDVYSILIKASFKSSRKKINDPIFWLPFLPGFNKVITLTDCTYLVDLFLSLGPVSRKTLLTFEFESEPRNDDVRFTFNSKNEHVSGLGHLILYPHSENNIQLKVHLDLHLKGRKSILLAPLIPSIKESWAKNILNEVKNSLENQ